MITYSSEEVLKKLKVITNDSCDSDLAKRLGVCKQSLSQYKNKNQSDIQLKIISLLINLIENKELIE